MKKSSQVGFSSLCLSLPLWFVKDKRWPIKTEKTKAYFLQDTNFSPKNLGWTAQINILPLQAVSRFQEYFARMAIFFKKNVFFLNFAVILRVFLFPWRKAWVKSSSLGLESDFILEQNPNPSLVNSSRQFIHMGGTIMPDIAVKVRRKEKQKQISYAIWGKKTFVSNIQ